MSDFNPIQFITNNILLFFPTKRRYIEYSYFPEWKGRMEKETYYLPLTLMNQINEK